MPHNRGKTGLTVDAEVRAVSEEKGYPTRAERRAAAQETAKMLMRQPPHKDRFRWDFSLAFGVAVLTVMLTVSPPQTKIAMSIWLVIMLGLGIYPVLHLTDWALSLIGKKGDAQRFRRIASVIVWTAVVIAFGYWKWPIALQVTPRRVTYGELLQFPPTRGETYTFRISNKSDEDIYASQIKFKLYSHTLGGQDFSVNIPATSRKAYSDGGDAAEHVADIGGDLCRDIGGHPVYSLNISRLTPHELREIVLSATRPGVAEISASTGFFATQPVPIFIKGNTVSSGIQYDEDMVDCHHFIFMLDGGIIWPKQH